MWFLKRQDPVHLFLKPASPACFCHTGFLASRRADPLWHPGWPQENAQDGARRVWRGAKLARTEETGLSSTLELRKSPRNQTPAFSALPLTSRSCPARGFPCVFFVPCVLGGSHLSSVTHCPDTQQPPKRDRGSRFLSEFFCCISSPDTVYPVIWTR